MKLNESELKYATKIVGRYDRNKRSFRWLRWVILLCCIICIVGYAYSSFEHDSVRDELVKKYADVAVENYEKCVTKKTTLERLRLETSSYKWLGLKLHFYVYFVFTLFGVIWSWRQHYVEPIQVKIYRSLLEKQNKSSAEQTLPQDT